MSMTYVGQELELFAHARNWKGYFATLLRPYVTGRVLEVGAGIGETTRALWRADVAAWTCLEPDAALAAQLAAARIVPDGAPSPEVVVGTTAALATGRAFDTILYVDVLEHIADDRGELRRAAAHLAPGGRLVVLSPAYQFLFSDFDRAIGHERRYTAGSLARVFPAALRREALFYADSLGALLSLGNRLLLRRAMPTLRQVRFWDGRVVPVSRVLDPLIGRRAGRSVIAVYWRPPA